MFIFLMPLLLAQAMTLQTWLQLYYVSLKRSKQKSIEKCLFRKEEVAYANSTETPFP